MRRSQRRRLKRKHTRSRGDRPLAAVSPPRRDAACEFPDRRAARRRRRARIVGAVLLVGAILLPWAAYRPMQAWLQGAAPAADVAAVATPAPPRRPLPAIDDVAGPARTPPASSPPSPAPAQAAATAATAAAVAPSRPPALALTVRGRAVEREAARSAAAGLPGVRSVGWLDRTRLYAVVEHDGLRGAAQIASICSAIAAHGDAREVEVHLQGPARPAAPLRARCGAAPGTPAAPAARSATEATAGAPQLPQSPSPPVDAEAFEARNAEAMRILEDTTPEM